MEDAALVQHQAVVPNLRSHPPSVSAGQTATCAARRAVGSASHLRLHRTPPVPLCNVLSVCWMLSDTSCDFICLILEQSSKAVMARQGCVWGAGDDRY